LILYERDLDETSFKVKVEVKVKRYGLLFLFRNLSGKIKEKVMKRVMFLLMSIALA